MIGTLYVPFSDKQYLIDQMLDNLKNMKMPRKDWKLLIYDVSGNQTINEKFQKWLLIYGDEYAKFEHVIRPPKITTEMAHTSCWKDNKKLTCDKGVKDSERV